MPLLQRRVEHREGSVTRFGTAQPTDVSCYESPKVLFNKCEVFLIFYPRTRVWPSRPFHLTL